MAERLNQETAATFVPTEYGNLSVTISTSMTELTDGIIHLSALNDFTNQAEDEAKSRGSNRVVVLEKKDKLNR